MNSPFKLNPMQKKKFTLSFFFLLTYLFTSYAQIPTLDWAYKLEDATHRADHNSNIYSIGTFYTSTIDMDLGPNTYLLTNYSNSTLFVRKMDENKNLLWAKAIGGTANVTFYPYSLFTDASSNVYIYGTFNGSADFDPGPGSYNLTGNWSIGNKFFCKYDSNGNFLWAKKINISPEKIAVDDLDNIYIVGQFSGTKDFNFGTGINNLSTSPSSTTNSFISKYDADLNYIWAKKFDASTENKATHLSLDDNANLYISGSFKDSVDFDPSSTVQRLHQDTSLISSPLYSDIYTCKMDSAGNYVWAKQFYGSIASYFQVSSNMVDSENNVYTLGYFNGAAGFNSDIPFTIDSLISGPSIFITKHDENGTYKWTKTIDYGQGNGITMESSTASDDLYLIGNFNGELDFDPGPEETTETGSFGTWYMLKLDQNGNYIWHETLAGNSVQPKYIDITTNNEIHFTCKYAGSPDLEPTDGEFLMPYEANLNGYFIAQWEQCSTVDTISAFHCTEYTVPSGNITYYFSGTYQDTISNNAGCDSLLTINVNLGIDETISISFDTLRANLDNASYQWLDCNNNAAPINGETNQMFIPDVDGFYAVEVTSNGCTEFSPCVQITGLGINENTFAKGIESYPNPIIDALTIQLGKTYQSVLMIIRNPLGQEIERKEFNNQQILKTTIQGESGVYFIELKDENNHSATFTIIKK
mgnify:CR=1 FL=1